MIVNEVDVLVRVLDFRRKHSEQLDLIFPGKSTCLLIFASAESADQSHADSCKLHAQRGFILKNIVTEMAVDQVPDKVFVFEGAAFFLYICFKCIEIFAGDL